MTDHTARDRLTAQAVEKIGPATKVPCGLTESQLEWCREKLPLFAECERNWKAARGET